MNGWNRKKTQYLAECIHEHEKADGVTYDPNGMVSYWNTKYNLVPLNSCQHYKIRYLSN